MKYIGLLVIGLMLGGCSSAASGERYGPKGELFLGSTYGYEDVHVRDNEYFVSYTSNSMAESVSKANRRAKEVCMRNGYPDYELKPGQHLNLNDDIIVDIITYGGAVFCKK